MLELLFLLLPVAAGYGYVMGRNSVRQAQRKQSSILSRHYYKGLNFLLSDQPDKAVDTLIKMINLDTGTVETHIAMGNFFRHRGEIDRAIRIHQNLVSKQELSESQSHQALRELGRDYMMAGFLERAENAFLQLLDSDKHFLDAQKQLFSIYQTTKEWDRAIELGEKMVGCHGDTADLCNRLSHFYCEQAMTFIKAENFIEAESSLQKAIDSDDHAVRPWLILGDLAIEQQDYQLAFDYLKEVPLRDVTWFSEAVPLLEVCAEKLQYDGQLEEILEKYWQQCATAYLSKVKLLAKKENMQLAEDVLFEQLKKTPTMKGFKTLMGFFIEDEVDQKTKESLTMVKGLVEEQIKMRPKYRCSSCGFSGRQIHWLCPSCKKWGVVKPIKGLDGE